ncbi:MobF family relaxase [Streptomyces vinaceus]
MLRFTRITGGEAGLNYLLSGSGCEAGHEPEAGQELEGPEAYYVKGTEHGAPLATWIGAGAAEFGVVAGEGATERDIRAIFGKHAHPEELRAAQAAAMEKIRSKGLTDADAEKVMAEAEASARRGRAAYQFKTYEERVEARIAREPHAEPERIEEIRREERGKDRAPAMYFDATFSAQKTISVYATALESAGRHEDAAKVRAAHREGIQAAMEYLQTEAGYSRLGYHSQGKGDRPSVGRYVDAHEWTAAIFDHEVSRAGDPQLHSHVAILNKTRVVDEYGVEHWVTLDSRAMNKARAAAAAIYERSMEQAIERELPVIFEQRPDGLAREIKGFEQELVDAMSTRSFEVEAEYQRMLAKYREDHGREPSAMVATRLKEAATLATRDPKRNEHQSTQARIERAERLAEQTVEGGLLGALDRAEAAGVEVRLAEAGAEPIDRSQIIREALEALQTKRATWDRSALIQQLNTTLGDQLPRDIPLAPLAGELADEALKSGAYGIVQTAGLQIVAEPEHRIRQSDGRSIYGPGSIGAERYALEEHLSTEDRVAARARQTGAPALSPVVVEQVVQESGVTHDQAQVVRGVLGDSRKVSVIEGPAGAGKSFATGVVAEAWQQHTGGRVIGLGPSAVAAEVLGEEGIELRENTTRFLMYAQGIGSRDAVAKFQLQAGDLVVLDEAGMASTDHIARVSQLCEDAGAKLILIGDQEQLQAVEAGGLFRTMVEDGPHYSLDNVRRFREQTGEVREWEAQASLALRRGDANALTAYDRHGRIQGGTLEAMTAAVVQAYVADSVAQRESVVITTTNSRATEVSREIRSQLVRYGLVEEAGTPLADDNRAGVGDLIQARNNDPQLRDDEGRLVLNRRVYRVTGVGEDGALTARRVAGRNEDGTERLAGTVTLPAAYVERDVALAYAGTVNAVQGRTVGYGGYLLVEEGMSRQQMYPGMTRAQRLNRAFAVSEVPANEHRVEGLSADPMSMMQGALERDGGELSALQELRESQDWAESLPALEPRWRDVIAGDTRRRYEGLLQQMLIPSQFAQLQTEDPSTLYRALREAELAGHDGETILRSAIRARSMMKPEPKNVASLLHYRIERELTHREPENEPAGHNWIDRTPAIAGDDGRFVRELAEAMDERRDVLGERLTEDAPEWAVRHLGPVPEDAMERAEWARRAGTVEQYRELYRIDAPNTAIGGVPPRGAVEQRAAWEAAHVALGRDEEERTLAMTSAGALREMVARYEREQAWAPAHVGEELSEARQVAMLYGERAILAQADADVAEDADRRQELEAEARGYEDLVDAFSERVRILEQIDTAREAWFEETAPAREAADAARTELARRAADEMEAQDIEPGPEDDVLLGEDQAVEYAVEDLLEIDWEIEGQTTEWAEDREVEVDPEPELTYAEQQELDQALAEYEEQYRAPAEPEAEAAAAEVQAGVTEAEVEPEQAQVEPPAIVWEVEGETTEQAPEPLDVEVEEQAQQPAAADIEVELQPVEAPEQQEAEQAPQAAPSHAEDTERQYHELYNELLTDLQQNGPQADRQQPAEQPAVEERAAARTVTVPQLPAQLADLQEDLERAQSALAEIAARRDARELLAQADEQVRVEQAEAVRGREVEAVQPQMEQEQGPEIGYGLE